MSRCGNVWARARFVVIVCALGLVPACRQHTNARSEPAPIRVGVFLSLTGQMQPYGENAREGLTLALEEINSAGGVRGHKLEIDVMDDRGEQIETLNVVKDLIDRRGLKYLVGGLTSSGTLDAADYARDKHVLLFSPAASHPKIPTVGFPFFLRNWPSDATSAESAASFAKNDLRAASAAIVYVNNAYGQGQREAFRAQFEVIDGKIVCDRGFPQDDTKSIRNLLTAVKIAKPDVVFITAYPKEYEEIFLQAKNLTLDVPRIATDTFDDPALLLRSKDLVEGTYFVVAAAPSSDYAPARDFRTKYSARFKGADGNPKLPGLASDTSYDALHLLADGLVEAGDDPAAVWRAIRGRKIYQGASGVTSFTRSGDVVKPLVVKIVRDGKATTYKQL